MHVTAEWLGLLSAAGKYVDSVSISSPVLHQQRQPKQNLVMLTKTETNQTRLLL